jgi:hypothetical protein
MAALPQLGREKPELAEIPGTKNSANCGIDELGTSARCARPRPYSRSRRCSTAAAMANRPTIQAIITASAGRGSSRSASSKPSAADSGMWRATIGAGREKRV